MPDLATTAFPLWRRPAILPVVCAALVIGALTAESVVALAITCMEGIPAWAALGLSSLAGVWIVRALRVPAAGLGRLIAGATLGAGMLSLLTFALGSVGLLNRAGAFLLVVALAVAGAAALLIEIRRWPVARPRRLEAIHWLWLLAVPFLVIAAAAACLPPGVLWKEEGFAYDVLEYHLAVPKIFMNDGRIHFLPDNVYSNFPLSSEMLSLLMMHLRGDPIEAAFMAVFVNVALGALFVAAAAWAGSAFGRNAGIVAGVTAASVPWLTYLAGIAYVEPGMLAAGMASLALLLSSARSRQAPFRSAITAGALAGLSCGFKYTAVPLIAFPLVMLTFLQPGPIIRRVQAAALFGLAALLAFSPWLVRNLVNTANPVFPLAYSVFGSKPDLWSPESEAVWQHAHGSSAAEQNAAPIWQRALERTVAEPLIGWGLFVLAAIGAIRRRDRWTAVLLGILLWQLIFWLAFTHLFARFAVVMLLPLLVLAGRSIEGLLRQVDARTPATPELQPAAARQVADSHALIAHSQRWRGGMLVTATLVLSAATNLYRIGRLYYDHVRAGGQSINAYGRTDWFVTGQWPAAQHWGEINALPAGARVMLVGEARTYYLLTPFEYAVVFNRHPLAEAVERIGQPDGVINWLRGQGVTHLLAHWSEMTRLAGSYGFYAALGPELFPRLEAAGLRRVNDYSLPEGDPPYATLYEVPQP